MTCIICLENMDMEEFNDDRQGTETCFKLECGHAYHTRCIITSLSRSNHSCPSCNKYKTPEQELEREFILRNFVTKIKKDERVKIAKKEYIAAESEYRTILKTLKKESKEWINKRAEELKIEEHKNYYLQAKRTVLLTSNEAATDLGPKYIGALKSDHKKLYRNLRGGLTFSQQLIFGSTYHPWKSYYLAHPYVRLHL